MTERMNEASRDSFTPEPLIQEPTALARLCEQLRDPPWLALDTEFMRTRTYYARV